MTKYFTVQIIAERSLADIHTRSPKRKITSFSFTFAGPTEGEPKVFLNPVKERLLAFARDLEADGILLDRITVDVPAKD